MTQRLVLCYHAVSAEWDWDFSVTAAQLERHVRGLLAWGYRPVTFAELARAPSGKTLAVTFDDGFRSVFEQAEPVLTRLGVPGTLFLPTDYIEAGAPLAWGRLARWLGSEREADLAPVSWAEAAALADRGWEIGSHTCTHRPLTDLADEELAHELRASRALCEARLERPCLTLAYPYGSYDGRVARAAEEAGYLAAATFPPHVPRPGGFTLPRVGVLRRHEGFSFRLQVSPLVRAVRGAVDGLR